MANDARRMTGAGLLAAATACGITSLFLPWGSLSSGAYGAPLGALLRMDRFFSSDPANLEANNPMAPVAAIVFVLVLVLLLAATVVAFTPSPKALSLSYTAEFAAFIALVLYVVALFLYTQQKGEPSFPLGAGLWVGLGMVVLAFAAPFFLKGPAVPATPAPVVGTPRVMRVTGPPQPPPGPKRMRCPNCGAINAVQPPAKPFCVKCGFGTPPEPAPPS